jgi:hypothetical protein
LRAAEWAALDPDPALGVFDSSPNLNDADEQALYGHAHQRLAAHGRSA